MEKIKFIATILAFGSIWGATECIIGGTLRDFNLPAGALLTGFFAVGLLSLNRLMFHQPGMQIGMGLVAGTLRLLNPFGSCLICSAIAIAAEGILFELIWTRLSLDTHHQLQHLPQGISTGIIAACLLYIGGFIITQILTPIFSSAGFYLQNLIMVLPQIFAGGLIAALIGGFTFPVVYQTAQLPYRLSNRLYLPTTLSISIICWILIIANTLFILGG